MKKIKKIPARLNLRKVISIGVMCFCLFFLTGVNFIVYPPQDTMLSRSLQQTNNTSDEESPTPVDEKSSAKTGLTVQEEYIHDAHHINDLSGIIARSVHKIPAVEKLQIVHFELISPPPKA